MINKSKDNNEEDLQQHSKNTGLGIGMGISVIFILLGFLLVFIPQITIEHICYALCGILVAFGIFMIVRYFLTEAYKNLSQYGFSSGALLVILGMCALVRIHAISEYFITCLGILVLITAIIELQNALDLFALKDKTWPAWIVLSIVFAVCAVLIVLDAFGVGWDVNLFTYYVMIGDGILSLISTFYLFLRIRSFNSKRSVEDKESEEEPDEVENNPVIISEEESFDLNNREEE